MALDETPHKNFLRTPLIIIRIVGWIYSRIVSFQPDTDIQKLISSGIWLRIFETNALLDTLRIQTVKQILVTFDLFKKLAHRTIIFIGYQWWLVTVIRGGTATPPNTDFIKTKKHQIFHGGAYCHDV